MAEAENFPAHREAGSWKWEGGSWKSEIGGGQGKWGGGGGEMEGKGNFDADEWGKMQINTGKKGTIP